MNNLFVFMGILAFFGSGDAAAGSGALAPAEAMKASAGPGFATLAEKTRSLAAAGDAVGLASHLAAVHGDAALDTPTRERLLYEGVQAAATIQPDDVLRAGLTRLAAYRTRTLIWTDEHGHREVRPLFDLASAVRHTRRVWSEQAARAAAATAIAGQDPDLVRSFATAGDEKRAGIAAAVRAAPADRLLVYQPALLTALEAGQPVGDMAAAVAARTLDAALMEKVLTTAAPDTALRALGDLESRGWSGRQTTLAAAAAGRPEIASAALLLLGRLGVTDAGAQTVLFEALAGPDGGSAAAALARHPTPDVIRRLVALLRSDRDEATRRHALLGLRLADSAQARAELTAFAGDPGSPADLVAEVPPWLRD